MNRIETASRVLTLLALMGAVLLPPTATAAQQAGAILPPQPLAPAPVTAAKPATVIVTLQTAEGPIVLELEQERAPITTRNFLRYIDEKRLDGASFYRAVNIAENFGLVQGGITVAQKLLPPIAHEPTSKTVLVHKTGTVSMARAAEGTARADFFIVIGDMPSLDAHADQPGDNSGFAAFGHVIAGMDIVTKIVKEPVSATLGAENGMAGQMLAIPVKILTARRSPDYKPAELATTPASSLPSQ